MKIGNLQAAVDANAAKELSGPKVTFLPLLLEYLVAQQCLANQG